MTKNKKVAIIGAGLGGISTAIHLAARGFEIEIYEKNSHLGGKLNEFKEDGFRWDIGPTLLTMPFVLSDLFSIAKKKLEDYLEIVPLETLCRYFWAEENIDAKNNIDEFEKELKKISNEDSKQLKKFLKYSENIYDLTSDIFLFNNPTNLANLINPKAYKALINFPKLDTNRTVHEANTSFFTNRKIIQLFDRYATYNGSNPYQAPATLNIIPHVEYTLGSYTVKGGLFSISNALKQLMMDLNIKINLNTKVEKILIEDKKAKGIEVDGKSFFYDYVVCNGDVVESIEKLTNETKIKKRLSKLEPSMSGFIVLLGVNKKSNNMAFHNVFFAENYEEEFKDIFENKMIHHDPTIYVSISSKVNDDDAPDGMENWFVLINAPYLSDNVNWEEEKNIVFDSILEKLRKSGIDIKPYIVYKKIFTPEDLYSMYLSNKGSIYGVSSNNRFSAFMRPKNQSPIKNLYFAGGSSHPGGGIPLVVLSGKITANLICKKEVVKFFDI